MSQFHSSIRELVEDVHKFLCHTLQTDVLSSASLTQRSKILSSIKKINFDYPELQLQLDEFDDINSTKRCSSSSPLPYVDMNGSSAAYKFPVHSLSADKDNYDLYSPKEKCDSPENQSFTGSEDYGSDDSKLLHEVSASDLYSSEKSGFLDKRKRETIKGWLNPFQKRWCAIKDGVLYYYEKSTDRKQKGSIILNGYEVRSVQDDSKEGKKYNYCFELVCPGKRTFQFSAASDTDRLQWVESIEKSCKLTFQGRHSLSLPPACNTPASLAVSEDIYEVVDDEDVSENTPITKPIEQDRADAKVRPESEDTVASEQMLYLNEWYVGLWDCSAADESELSFYRGDSIRVVSKEYDSFSWWIGELQGKTGFVPKTYLMEAYETC